MTDTIAVAFTPLQYVRVTLHELNYRGRVIAVIVKPADVLYEVEFADDKGDLQVRCFRADEIEARA